MVSFTVARDIAEVLGARCGEALPLLALPDFRRAGEERSYASNTLDKGDWLGITSRGGCRGGEGDTGSLLRCREARRLTRAGESLPPLLVPCCWLRCGRSA